MSETLIFLLFGIMFLSVIFWQTRRDRLYLFELEKRLEEKEKRLYELYQAVEDIINGAFPEAASTLRGDYTRTASGPRNSSEDLKQNINKVYNDKRKAVILMHKSGSSEEEIAKALGIGKGEVKLILGLRDEVV